MKKIISLWLACAVAALGFVAAAPLGAVSLEAAEYFVAKKGSDAKAGTSRAEAFATIQHGVDTLKPGDTLTITPGEYFEAVERTGLGGPEAETKIRAEIPGTVVLRGDTPAPKFSRVAGTKFTWAADFEFTGQVPVVNEIDTLATLSRMPNSAELEFVPGTFYHDVAAKKLYVASSDMTPVTSHRYSVSVIPKDGLYLTTPKRVTIEGLAITGFSSMEVIHYRRGTAGGVWGLFLYNAHGCTVRDCRAYLNAWGIGMNSEALGSGENVVERCEAWGNNSQFAYGDMGGITIFAGRRDTIRNSTAYLNGMYGINIYGTGGAPPGGSDGGNDPEKKSRLLNNVAWGNTSTDFKIKTGYEYFHTVENSVSLGNIHSTNLISSITKTLRGVEKPTTDFIVTDKETEFDPNVEFADPDNRDYRLQATSRFRKTGPNGTDRGPAQYQANIFYVKPDGDDAADGLSIGKAWKTLARGVEDLQSGDTLYLSPGRYAGGIEFSPTGAPDAPIFVRGRGIGAVLIEGGLAVRAGGGIRFERLMIDGRVGLADSADIGFAHCTFTAKDTAILADNVQRPYITHSQFTGFEKAALSLTKCADVRLTGNIFNNARGAAVQLSGATGIRYSNHNSYAVAKQAWKVDGATISLAEKVDQQSQELAPQFATVDGIATLKNPEFFTGSGPFGKALGPYRDQAYRAELRLVEKPIVHSVSATTANLEWITSLPATCDFAWGETPACEKKGTFDVNRFGTYSFNGLKPATKYYFRLTGLSIPTPITAKYVNGPVALDEKVIDFTTLAADAKPATYYVAIADGSDTNTGLTREQAFKTIRHAASRVNVGDKVLIAGGKYTERVRMRATGAPGAPITFRSISGERVEMDGATQALNNAFVVGHKSHLRFDGFYLANFNMFPESRWPLGKGAEFHLYEGKDIEISRCFSDGRGGYSAESVDAYYIEDLKITNCVSTNKMGGSIYIWRCPNLVVNNNVFAGPMIFAMVVRNTKTQPMNMDNNIFTDMFDKKARLNLGLLCVDGEIEAFRQHNNCYQLRDVIPLSERALLLSYPADKVTKHIIDPLFADPKFAGIPEITPAVIEKLKGRTDFPTDRLMDAAVKADFNSFFATNPEVIKRGIGLQREAFKEFRFQVSTPK